MAFDFGKITSLFKGGTQKNALTQFVGVDIGASSIKVVQLRDEKGTPTLDTYGELQLGPYADTDIGAVTALDQKKLTEALVDIMRESSISGNTVAFAIPYASSFMVRITLATLDADEISSRIPVEARKYIPVSLQEVSLDWIELSQDTEAKTTTILVVAIYNEALQKTRGVLEGAGLTIAYNELEPFSAVRSVGTEDEALAFVDFGAETTKLYIVHKGVVVDAHSLLLSGTEITNTYMSAQSIDFKTAEEVKRTLDITTAQESGVKEVTAALSRGLREFSNVIARTEKELAISVSRVVLLGGGALLPGISAFTQDALQKPIVVGDPFAKVAYPAFLEKTFREIGPSFSVAMGVALQLLEMNQE
ncbi:type IV pilus assembly protein PilM [Candidatus Kaiserbacteria bacterium]|nr:type IV pilus assembly protein PilM [Candidatus Kaiserbacteria bacterium]